MENRFQLRWDEKKLAAALKISVKDVREYFTDGRRVSFIIERRLMQQSPGWKLASSESAEYDLLDPTGGRWEARSITQNGVYFNPSNQVGSGRTFNEKRFIAKLSKLEGFILSDIVEFPVVDVFVVPVGNVICWYKEKSLGITAKASRKKFLTKLQYEIRY